jgi:hypothetical protein
VLFIQPHQPIIVKVIEAPSDSISLGDVVLQALGLSGVILVAAILLGVLLGGLFIGWRRYFPANTFNGDGSEAVRLGLEPPMRSDAAVRRGT